MVEEQNLNKQSTIIKLAKKLIRSEKWNSTQPNKKAKKKLYITFSKLLNKSLKMNKDSGKLTKKRIVEMKIETIGLKICLYSGNVSSFDQPKYT